MPCYTGDLAAGERVIASLRHLGTPIVDTVAAMPYPALFDLTVASGRPGFRHDGRSLFLKSPDSGGLAAFIDVAPSLVSAESLAGMLVMGGAAGRVPASATAFAHRDAGIYAFVQADWSDASQDSLHRARVARFWTAMRPYSAGEYANMMYAGDADRIGEAYPPATYSRLAALKRRYDPSNMFRDNQNILPATQLAARQTV
jgi:hypothetical protein